MGPPCYTQSSDPITRIGLRMFVLYLRLLCRPLSGHCWLTWPAFMAEGNWRKFAIGMGT